jgi:transketolase
MLPAQRLPTGICRVAIEAGVAHYWRKYMGLDGAVVGIDTFGESAPGALLFAHFGFTAEEIARKSRGLFLDRADRRDKSKE